MLVTLALLCAVAHQAPQSMDLVRGRRLPDSGIADQDVEETILDADEPDTAHGGYYTLDAGPNKTLLIRFGQLARHLAHSGGVAEAELILVPSSDAKAGLKSAARLLKPWGQGPALRLSDLIKQKAAAGQAPSDSLTATWGAATWRESRSGVAGARWQSPGAHGQEDARPIEGVKLATTDQGVVISGLGPAVEAMLKGENDGLALTFDAAISFYSSSAPFGKPILRVVPKPVPSNASDLAVAGIDDANGLHGTIINKGKAPAPAFKVRWLVDGNAGTPVELPAGLAPGETKTFDYAVPGSLSDKDHRRGAVTLEILTEGADADWSNNRFTYYPKGVAVNADLATLDLLNEVVFARSRYAAAPDGCLERVRPSNAGTSQNLKDILLGLGAPDLGRTEPTAIKAPGFFGSIAARFPDLTGGGDTRYDGGLLPSTNFTQAAFLSPADVGTPSDPTYLLSPNATAALNAAIGLTGEIRAAALRSAYVQRPSATALRASDAAGRPLATQALTLYDPAKAEPVATLTTDDKGLALLPNSVDLAPDQVVLVSAAKNGQTEWDAVRGWQLNAAALRGAKATFIDLRFALPAAPVDYTVDLAQAKAITDSANRTPTLLAPLVSGQAGEDVSLPKGDDAFVEIDLNRDRTLAEIRLIGGPSTWTKFDLYLYNTGQKPTDAVLYAHEENFQVTARARGKQAGVKWTVPYRGDLVQARFLRIVNRSDPGADSNAGLAQIEVFGRQQNP